jgi:hypothetical protein
MREYIPSKRVPIAGLSFLVLSSILTGLLIGGTAFALSRVVYLIFLFPIAMGYVGMIAVSWVHKRARVPNQFVIIASGIVTGTTIYAAYHYADYLTFRITTALTIKEEFSVDNRLASRGVDYILRQETGSTGFLGFVKLHAREGNTFGGFVLLNEALVMEMPQFTIKGAGAWAYWLFEAIVVVGATTWASAMVAQGPFCESGSDWYGQSTQMGNVNIEREKAFLDLLGVDDFSRAGEMIIKGETTTHPTIEVYIRHCRTNMPCTVLVTLKRTWLNSKSKVEREIILHNEISQKHYLELVESAVPEDV